ncbi:hypothetical protein F5050DRAFT_1813321 [Lentinula boryana]|uniref:Uncharacterized protein n=1 Tax=Lentinula boryana TaxID=40481 RepID=A0ABQ8PWQ4_9AGAR|nr:hypothetical protein F5050DRAFT_1813321 [Lentinula boryana]
MTRKESINMGNDIPDPIFCKIVLAAFPTVVFDTIMQNINANPSTFTTSTAVIQQITFQYSRSVHHPNVVIPGEHLSQVNSVTTLASRIESIERQLTSSANMPKNALEREAARKGNILPGGEEGEIIKELC